MATKTFKSSPRLSILDFKAQVGIPPTTFDKRKHYAVFSGNNTDTFTAVTGSTARQSYKLLIWEVDDAVQQDTGLLPAGDWTIGLRAYASIKSFELDSVLIYLLSLAGD